MKTKAQSSIEFIALIAAMFIFFIIIASTFQQNIYEKQLQKRKLLTKELARTVQAEINLASEASEGYERTFTIPPKILNLNYTITIQENFVMVNTTIIGVASLLPVKNITGQIQAGDNTIRKTSGQIFLN